MCEQTEVQYLEGDIVWVKLGKCWWPGEVKDYDKIDDDIKNALRKRPIAVVKFFQEDSFEYVKNLDNIYKYNCRKKHDFIKKGLDMYRKESNDFMNKFPGDIIKAEELTNGDPDILESDEFIPEKKLNYSDIFGTAGAKKTPKDIKGKGRPSKITKSAESDRKIFHRPYVRKSDYGVTYLEQTTPPPNTSKYTCHICGYESTRLNVMVLHNKSHIRGYFIPNSGKKSPKKRVNISKKATKLKFASTTNFEENLQLIRQGYMLSDGSEESEEEVDDVKKSPNKRSKVQKTKSLAKKPKTGPSMACSDLLAEWSDNEAEEPKESEESPKSPKSPKILAEKPSENISNTLLAEWDTNSDTEMENKNETNSNPKETSKSAENGKDCFDFKEEEFTVLQKSPGRKIPRVIPHKRKSTDPILDDKDDKVPESEETKIAEKESEAKEAPLEVNQEAFENLLEETAVPNLPTIDTLKSAQNFQLAKPQKSPDKAEDNLEKTNGVFKGTHREPPSECPIPKKRFARNFEDFQSLEKEVKSPESQANEDKSNLEVSKLKTQLMTKLQESPVEEKKTRGRSKRTQKGEESEKLEEVIQNVEQKLQSEHVQVQVPDQNKEEVIEKSVAEVQKPQDVVEKVVEKIQEKVHKESRYRRGKRSQKSSKSHDDVQETVKISPVNEKVQQETHSQSRRSYKEKEVLNFEETEDEVQKNDEVISEKSIRRGRHTLKEKEVQKNLEEIQETSSSRQGRKNQDLLEEEKSPLPEEIVLPKSPITETVTEISIKKGRQSQKGKVNKEPSQEDQKCPIPEEIEHAKSPIPEVMIELSTKKDRQSQKRKMNKEMSLEEQKSSIFEEVELPKSPISETLAEISTKKGRQIQKGKTHKELSLEERKSQISEEVELPKSSIPETMTEISTKKGRQSQKGKTHKELSLEEQKSSISEKVEHPKSPIPEVTSEVSTKKGRQSHKGKTHKELSLEEQKSSISEGVELPKSPIPETLAEISTKKGRQSQKAKTHKEPSLEEQNSAIAEEVEHPKSPIPETLTEISIKKGRQSQKGKTHKELPLEEQKSLIPKEVEHSKSPIPEAMAEVSAKKGGQNQKGKIPKETLLEEQKSSIPEEVEHPKSPIPEAIAEVLTKKGRQKQKGKIPKETLLEEQKSSISEGIPEIPSRRGRHHKETLEASKSPIREESLDLPSRGKKALVDEVQKSPPRGGRRGRSSKFQKEIQEPPVLDEQTPHVEEVVHEVSQPEEVQKEDTSVPNSLDRTRESQASFDLPKQKSPIPEVLKSPTSEDLKSSIPEGFKNPTPEGITSPISSRRGRHGQKEVKDIFKSPVREESSEVVTQKGKSSPKEIQFPKSPIIEDIPETSSRKSRQSRKQQKESDVLQDEHQGQTEIPEGLRSPIHEETNLSGSSTRKGRRAQKDSHISQIEHQGQTEISEDLKSLIPVEVNLPETSTRKGRRTYKAPEILHEEHQGQTEITESLKSPIPEESNLSEISNPKEKHTYEELEVLQENHQRQVESTECLKSPIPEEKKVTETYTRKGRRVHKEPEAMQEEHHGQTDIIAGFKSPIREERTLPESSTRKGRRAHKGKEIEPPSPMYEEIEKSSAQKELESLKSTIPEVQEPPFEIDSHVQKEIELPKVSKVEDKDLAENQKSPIPDQVQETQARRRRPSQKDTEKSPVREEIVEISTRRSRSQKDKETPIQKVMDVIQESPVRVGRRGRKSSRFQETPVVEESSIIEETSTLAETTILEDTPVVIETPIIEEQITQVQETSQFQEDVLQDVPQVAEIEEKPCSKGRRSRKEKQVTKQDPDTLEEKLPEISEEKVLEEVQKVPPKTIPQRGNRRRSKRFSQDEIEKDSKIEDLELQKEVIKRAEETSLQKIVLHDSAKEIVQEATPIITEDKKITHETPPVIEEMVKPNEEEHVSEGVIEMGQKSEENLQEQVILEQPNIENPDNLSGLTTLATVSEMSSFVLDQKEAPQVQHEEKISVALQEKKVYPSPKKGATLATFSMDYSDSNEAVPSQIIEKVPQHVEEVLPIEESVVPMEEIQSNFPVQEETVISEGVVKDSFLGAKIQSVTSDKTKDNNRETVPEIQSSPSKLLEILTEPKSKKVIAPIQKQIIQSGKPSLVNLAKPNTNKFIIKSSRTPSKNTNKPIILSEKIIKPVTDTETVSVRKVTSKRTYQDVEDIDTFIIEKPTKKANVSDDVGDIILTPKTEVKQIKGRASGTRGKPKIIEQTIIKAADIPTTETGPLLDDAMFDINSMPIVLSDQILTPETIENMPVITDMPSGQGSSTQNPSESTVLKRGGMLQQVKLLKKPAILGESPKTPQTVIKGLMPKGLTKNQKVYASSTKLLKSNPTVITQPGKPGKFIILPTSSPSTSSGSKYTVGKRIAMKTPEGTPKVKSLQGLSPEPSGNKIMIITNNQGEQSRVLLTPAQQKMLAGKMPTTKITKTSQLSKGNLVQKSILTSKGTLLPVTQSQKTLVTQAIMTSKGQIIPTQGQTLVTSEGQVLTPLTPQQLKSMKNTDPKKRLQQRILLPEKTLESSKSKIIPGKKTILLKSSPGQTYKKIVESPKQVLTSLEPGVSKQITTKTQVVMSKAQAQSSMEKISKPTLQVPEKTNITKVKPPTKAVPKGKILSPQKVPPLAPITKKETVEVPKKEEQVPAEQKHLIIQDNMGNQTTVTEGQILALPRETVDGQPQSYMLVTVDESGNLVPLSNEALMSLDPNLAQGGDLNNLVLQFDPNQQAQTSQETNQTESNKTELVQTENVSDGQGVVLDQTTPVQEQVVVEQPLEDFGEQIVTTETSEAPQKIPQEVEQQTLACNISTGETSQQLIITGDPESTQKFLASLSEGNTDLSSLLTGGEGNIIINADGRQILLNTGDPESQILLMPSTSESQIYESQIKNQDILAAALADTDVFQGESQEKTVVEPEKSSAQQLSPNSGLYPVSVGNVLETSLTLGSPIMTPLEVPSNKVKHDIESTIITQVPSSLELPITITDPSIAQTVSQQVMLSNELVQTNLKHPISVSKIIQTTEMNSPNFVYSLPNLEEGETKTLSESTTTTESVYSMLGSSMSMPLLTEEPDVAQNPPEESSDLPSELPVKMEESSKDATTSFQDTSVAEMTKKLSTITKTLEMSPIEDDLEQNNDFCDSLSEPPPGMFEKSSFLTDSYLNKPTESDDIPLPEDPKTGQDEMGQSSSPFIEENSCEIPIQPQIITSLDNQNIDKIDNETQPNLLDTKSDD